MCEVACTECESKTYKVLYAGFPMRLCSNPHCAAIFGFWAFVLEWLPFTGYFVKYDHYWSALWWLVKGCPVK